MLQNNLIVTFSVLEVPEVPGFHKVLDVLGEPRVQGFLWFLRFLRFQSFHCYMGLRDSRGSGHSNVPCCSMGSG